MAQIYVEGKGEKGGRGWLVSSSGVKCLSQTGINGKASRKAVSGIRRFATADLGQEVG